MKKSTFLVSLIGLLGFMGSAAYGQGKNLVYLELAGKGLYYSLNYERSLFNLTDELSMAASVGFCRINGNTDIEKSHDITLPLEMNFQYAFDNHRVVLGYGTTYWRYFLPDIPIYNNNLNQQPLRPELKKVTEWFAHGLIEYRYQKNEGGLLIKAGYVPLFFAKMENFAYQKKMNLAHSFNIGVGYSF
jgi:hypothetical protein